MICPKCGAQNVDGSKFCQNCGEVFAAQPTQPMQQAQPMQQQYQQTPPMQGQPMGQPMYAAPVYGQPMAPAKKKTGLIVGISVAAVVVAAVLIVLFVVILPNTGLKGKIRHRWTVSDGGVSVVYDFKKNEVDMDIMTIPFEWSVSGDNRVTITVSLLGQSESEDFIVSFSNGDKTMTMTSVSDANDITVYTRS